MENKTITVPTLLCRQGEKQFFAFHLSATLLSRICYVSTREAEGDNGYQRLLDKKRADSIKTYIEMGGVLPNNIVINFTDSKVIHYDEQNNTLTFPNSPRTAWVIDGQHRLYGSNLLNDLLFGQQVADNYDFVVSAFVGLDKVDQARLFLDINRYQEGVDKSLLYDLMDMFKDDESFTDFYTARASDIVKRLNADPESPFYQKISITRDRVKGTISQGTFVDALLPHIERGGILSHTNEYDFTLEMQYGVLFNYFSALRNTLSSFWFNEKSLLTKTTGFNALMLALPTVFQQTVNHHKSFELPNVEKVVAPLHAIPWFSKELEGQQGTVAARKLAEAVRRAIVAHLEVVEGEKTKTRLVI